MMNITDVPDVRSVTHWYEVGPEGGFKVKVSPPGIRPYSIHKLQYTACPTETYENGDGLYGSVVTTEIV